MLSKSPKLLVMFLISFAALAASAQTVKATIALPASPIGVAVDSALNRIYAAVPTFNESYDYLSVIDGANDVIVKNIQIPPIATAVAVDSLRSLVYVGGQSTVDASSSVVVVNSRTYKVIKTISITSTQSGTGILGLAVNRLTGTLYAANSSDNEVDVIDVEKGSVTARIATTGEPISVSVNPISNTIYATCLDGMVDLIDGKTNTVTSAAAFGAQNQGVAVDPATGNVLAVSQPESGGTTSKLGLLNSAGSVLSTFSVGQGAVGIDVDPLTHLVFVANSFGPGVSSSISAINDSTNTVVSTTPADCLYLAVNPVTEKIYVSPASSAKHLTVLTEPPPAVVLPHPAPQRETRKGE